MDGKEKFVRLVLKAISENDTRYNHYLCSDGKNLSYSSHSSEFTNVQIYDFSLRELEIV